MLLALLAVALVAATVVPVLGPLVLTADLVVLAAAVLDARRAARIPLAASRTWPSLVVQGEVARVAVELECRGGRELHLQLRDGLHPAVAACPARTRAVVRPGSRLRWDFTVTVPTTPTS